MPDHEFSLALIVVSFIAYIGCAYLAACVVSAWVRSKPEVRPQGWRGRRVCAVAAALACFLCIPPGSLPPVFNTPWSGAVCIALFWFSLICSANTRASTEPLYRSPWATATLLTLTGAGLACYVWMRGIPGNALNFGTYAAMPAWETAAAPTTVGLAILLACLLAGAHLGASGAQRLVFAAITAVWLTPWNPTAWISLGSFAGAFIDFLFFWCKVLVLSWIGMRVGGAVRPRLLWPIWCLGMALSLGPELMRIGAG